MSAPQTSCLRGPRGFGAQTSLKYTGLPVAAEV